MDSVYAMRASPAWTVAKGNAPTTATIEDNALTGCVCVTKDIKALLVVNSPAPTAAMILVAV